MLIVNEALQEGLKKTSTDVKVSNESYHKGSEVHDSNVGSVIECDNTSDEEMSDVLEDACRVRNK